MDQQAFRQLLATPRPGSASQSGSGTRAFGRSNKRSQPAAGDAASSSSTTPSDLRPRKLDAEKAKRPPKPRINPLTGEAYVDRATARRSGKESEFADVEKLLADFEARAAQLETEEEREELREQIKYLGGDEKHTVLVKGLDFALLAQNKARLESEGGQTGDDDLERAFESAKSGSAAAAEEQNAPEPTAGTKRSRESILEALKKRKLGQSSSSSSGGIATQGSSSATSSSKFKPIGFKPIGAAPSSSSTTTTTTTDDPDVKYINGKRMRKKKKDKKPDAGSAVGPSQDERASTSNAGSSRVASTYMPPPPTPAAAAAAGAGSTRRTGEGPASRTKQPDSASGATSASPPPTSPVPARHSPTKKDGDVETAAAVGKEAASSKTEAGAADTGAPLPVTTPAASGETAAEVEDDEDVDIFAEAGRWSGLSDQESDTEAADSAAPAASASPGRPPPAVGSGQKRDWFSTSGSVAAAAAATSEDERHHIPHRAAYDDGPTARPSRGPSHHDDDDDDGDEGEAGEDEEGQERPTRLQGFSDSALPSELTRALLEREKQREEKRKLKEEAWKEKRKAKKQKKERGAQPNDEAAGGDKGEEGEEEADE